MDITVHAWGAGDVSRITPGSELAGEAPAHGGAADAVNRPFDGGRRAGCQIVHSHTWYANLGGHLSKLIHGIPHVATAHSLEPFRPWKAEQLGGGYAISSWVEKPRSRLLTP